MSDDLAAGGSEPGALCPWCSAPLDPDDTVTCSSCGAALQAESEQQVPGLTAIDPVAVLEGARPPQRPRNRLVAWLTGADIEEAAAPQASPEALAPPPPDVRREILRLQMEAELVQLSAEVESLATDEAIAAQEVGDTVRARAAVAAVLGVDATTDSVIEAAEAAAAEVAAEAAAGAAAVDADDPGSEPVEAAGGADDDAGQADDAATPDESADRPTEG
jgi:hypothetical protein